jgi:hypothetical protein
MNTFKCLYHSIDVASAFNTAVNSAICHLNKYLEHHNICRLWWCDIWALGVKNIFHWCEETNLLNRLVVVFWVHKFGAAKFSSWTWTQLGRLSGFSKQQTKTHDLVKSGVFTFFKSVGVQVNTNYPWGSCNPCTFCSLNHINMKGK